MRHLPTLLVSPLALLALACASHPTPPPPAATAPTPFAAALRTASPGDVLTTPWTSLDPLPRLPLYLATAPDSPQFLLSDKPEYFRTGDGISLQETVAPGLVRLYLYHVPEPTGKPKVIPAVIDNLSDLPLTLTLLRRGAPKPSGDYHALARQAVSDFWNDALPPPPPVIIPPRGRHVLDPQLSASPVTTDVLVHGIYEFRIDRPARVSVFQKDPAAPVSVLDVLPPLPRVLPGHHPSGAGRGLFARSNVDATLAHAATYDTASPPAQLLLADGQSDPWITGRDSLDPSTPAVNKGNYGVMYRVKIRYRSTTGRPLSVLICTDRTGQWCDVVAAAARVNNTTVLLPSTAPRFGRIPLASLLHTFPPAPKGQTLTAEFTYTPPGACCLPTPLLLVPVERPPAPGLPASSDTRSRLDSPPFQTPLPPGEVAAVLGGR